MLAAAQPAPVQSWQPACTTGSSLCDSLTSLMRLHGAAQGPEHLIQEQAAGCGWLMQVTTSNDTWGSPELLLLLTDGLELQGSALLDLLGLPGSSLSSFDAAVQPCQGHLTNPRLQVHRSTMLQPSKRDSWLSTQCANLHR